MRNMGLIRGATEANVIVLTDTGVKNGSLRFPDEFVRHKVLDLIGDACPECPPQVQALPVRRRGGPCERVASLLAPRRSAPKCSTRKSTNARTLGERLRLL